MYVYIYIYIYICATSDYLRMYIQGFLINPYLGG